ncbi:UNVERIFIED_CONTAM: hypothetical protein K2H54_031741 [Gekko kuhli]
MCLNPEREPIPPSGSYRGEGGALAIARGPALCLVPGHPKSNDLIKDFTVASDSGGVGELRLTVIPGQRLVESASGESISSAIGLQEEGTRRTMHQFRTQTGQ